MRILLYISRSGVKGAMFLLPLLGLTWIFGLLAVNEDTIIFQYLFAIFNSLQVLGSLNYTVHSLFEFQFQRCIPVVFTFIKEMYDTWHTDFDYG